MKPQPLFNSPKSGFNAKRESLIVRSLMVLLAFLLSEELRGQTVITVGSSGADFTTIETAYSNGIPASVAGPYVIELQTNYNPAAEVFPISLVEKTGVSAVNTVTIRPAADVVTPFQITTSELNATFFLAGADYVIIDGRPGGAGNSKFLIIENTSVNVSNFAGAIGFINDASNNVVRYCIVKGSSPYASYPGGVVAFLTSAYSTGNDNNTIQYCDITSGSSAKPITLIGSFGSSGKTNSGNIIEYNNLFDQFSTGSSGSGIHIGSFSENFVIRNNSFYETIPVTLSSSNFRTHINIRGTDANGGHEISTNYLGGNAPLCAGSAMDLDGSAGPAQVMYRGIYIEAGGSTSISVQNNVVRNISIKSSHPTPFAGIYVSSGSVDIGTVTANIIGSASTTGSISVTSYSSSANTTYGIYLSGSGTFTVSNNNIGSITATNNAPTTETAGITCIYSTGTGSVTINNNIIGSDEVSNSIWAASNPSGTDVQNTYGILAQGNGPTIVISGNTIANLRNDYSGTTDLCGTYGIGVQGTGNYSIANNKVSYLYNANGNISTTEARGLAGIYNVATGNSGSSGQHITGNTVNNLYSTYSGANAVIPVGIYFEGEFPDTKAYESNIANNYIHSIFKGSTSTSSGIAGIILNNTGTPTYIHTRNVYNNIISLGTGENDNCLIYGIYEMNSGKRTINLYFNTVYIGGTPAGNINTFAANISGSHTNNVRNIRNNLLVNSRSRTSGTGRHFAMYFGNTVGATLNYNCYYAPGTGGALGYFSFPKSSLPIINTQDANSKTYNPQFVNPGGIYPADLRVQNDSLIGSGIAISGYTTDYDGVFVRPNPPTIGAIEFNNPLPVELTSFIARVSGGRVTLLWETATEVDNYGFEIERRKVSANDDSMKVNNWHKVGFVEGHSTTNSPKYYSFEDGNIAPGRYFYRLKQIDNDGDFAYSAEVFADVNSTPSKYRLDQNFPNPFNPSTVITWAIPVDGDVKLSVFNLLGEEVAVLFKGVAKAGNYSSSFDASSLPSGVYVYRLSSGIHSSMKKMLLQK